MAQFHLAIEKTLALEGFGKLVNLKGDTGKLTKWGISQTSYPEEDIANLNRERALELYHRDFWHPLYDQIIDQEIADELFDFGVNTSARGWPKIAIKVFQEALRYLIVGPLVVDGEFGERTLASLHSVDSRVFLREFRARQVYYYADIVIRQPDAAEPDKKRWLLGWFRRVMA